LWIRAITIVLIGTTVFFASIVTFNNIETANWVRNLKHLTEHKLFNIGPLHQVSFMLERVKKGVAFFMTTIFF
jgi:hypothetical protein